MSHLDDVLVRLIQLDLELSINCVLLQDSILRLLRHPVQLLLLQVNQKANRVDWKVNWGTFLAVTQRSSLHSILFLEARTSLSCTLADSVCNIENFCFASSSAALLV
jgi:hypothetical protein